MPPPPDLAAHLGLAAAERMRRIVAAAEAGEPPDAADLGWLARGLGRYLAGAPAGLRVEEALGLAVLPGGSPWWAEQRRAGRDRLLRELAGTFPGPPWSRAQAVADALRRYRSTPWRHDKMRGGPLTSDQRRKIMFAIFSTDEDPPTGTRRVYDIITTG
jgi:hypothetical protein